MQGLNRQELEDYVIDLYHNQKKTFREIQKIVRKNPRDIKTILDKVEPEAPLFLHLHGPIRCLRKAVLQLMWPLH